MASVGNFFSKQENLFLLAIGRNVCWDCSLREGEMLLEMNMGKLLISGSSCLMLFKEKTLQFMVIEVACN